ncbi:MAG: LysM domain-containing protein, partial [Lachnospiraceae bacterium]|nr:LysM domain-containing protein [Lachnospiraceae bacterium]
YYERNEMMQSYIQAHSKMGNLNCEEVLTEEVEEKEDITKHFRNIIQERKEEVHQKKVMTYLYMTSTFLVVIVFVIGITMMNNYDKMKSMEASLQYISEALEEEKEMAASNHDDEVEEAMQVIADEDLQSVSNNEEEKSEKTEQEEVVEPEVVQQDVAVSDSAEIAPSEEIADNNKTYDTYTVVEGDTLAKICKDHYGNYDMLDQLCELNQIKNKDKILYGQKILLP